MPDALDRIQARATTARTAAAPPLAPPVQPPPQPVAPPGDQADLAGQVADLNDVVAGLADRVGVLEQAAVDAAMSDLDGWVDPGAMAALPAAPAAGPGYEPAAYQPQPDETVMCPSCGKLDAPDAKFCDQCGFQLEGAPGVQIISAALPAPVKA